MPSVRRLWSCCCLAAVLLGGCDGSAAHPSRAGSAAATSKPAAPSAVSSSLTPVKISYVGVNGTQLALLAAQETGLFSKNGIDVGGSALSSNAAAIMAALLSGQIQVAWTDATSAVNATAGGADVLVIASLSPVYSYVLDAAPDIKSVQELRGKKIGVGSLTGGDAVATKVALNKIGIDWTNDLSLVAVGTPQNRQAAMFGGSVQAVLEQPPESLVLESKGFHPVLSMRDLNLPSVNASIVVAGAYARTHRDVVQRFTDSLIQGIAEEKADRSLGISILKKVYKSDDEAEMAATYDWYAPTTPNLPHPKADLFSAELQVLAQDNPKLVSVDLNKIVDASFVQSAADRKLQE